MQLGPRGTKDKVFFLQKDKQKPEKPSTLSEEQPLFPKESIESWLASEEAAPVLEGIGRRLASFSETV